jgi:hypothetical protein
MSVIGTPVTTGYTGALTSSALVKLRIGTANAAAFSSTDGSGAVDETAIQAAIVWAEGYVYSRLRHLYATPFVWTSGSVDPVAQEWATILAVWWLYGKRGIRDDAPGGDYQKQYEAVLGELKVYAAGFRRLQASKYAGAIEAISGFLPLTDINGNLVNRYASAVLEQGPNEGGW